MKKIRKKSKWWHDRHSNKRAKSTKKRKKICRTVQFQSNNILIQEKNKNEVRCTLPKNFSIIENSNVTIMSFNKLFDYIYKNRHTRKHIFMDLSQTESFTIDAIMFLLAIVNNLKQQYRVNLSFKGNSPQANAPKKIFDESGFYNYVKYLGEEELDKNDDNIQIVSGVKCNVKLAQRISDYVQAKLKMECKKLHFLYVMMIELMTNTNKQAYCKKSEIMDSKWFCYVRCTDDKTIAFSFLDTGAGIPSTIKKNFFEQIKSFASLQDTILMVSALNGEFRSQTSQGNRGKGIPKRMQQIS